ncbi:dienelactone hydrolase [Amaricoccus sp.]|uniref:dienelactone hydrolase family protein n=1 Tax=Amaricoccus sp. TaxID=1872485 RepID=UPI00262F5692|nr:dienelactone hydrolase [Amaricoccus sp.]HRO11884.1 dienelactone hydrolase [Amaricoccus sp.]
MSRRRRRWLRRALLAAALVAAGVLAVGGNLLSRYRGWTVERLEPDALSALLAPAYRVMKPPGAGPFPTALLFSGCDGPRDNVLRWAERLNREGWAAVVVDSHGPRGLVDLEVWRLVCAGQILMGSERAGDVLIAVDDARRMPFVDPGRIALVGASHGGWAIMDLLAMDPPKRLPYNLAGLRPDAPADPLAGVAGVILLYPYCGEANLARGGGWTRAVPTLFLLSRDDYVAPAEECLEIADALAARGLPVETLVIAGVTHGFDQEERSTLSPLAFDAAGTAAALDRATAFLETVGAR